MVLATACDPAARSIMRCAGAAERLLDQRLLPDTYLWRSAVSAVRSGRVLLPLHHGAAKGLDEAVLSDGGFSIPSGARVASRRRIAIASVLHARTSNPWPCLAVAHGTPT